MVKLSLQLLVALHFVLTFTACSISKIKPLDIVETNSEPLSLSISDEFNDGSQLFVLAVVTANKDYPVQEVLLRLHGLNQGEAVVSKDFKISSTGFELVANSIELIKKGEERRVSMIIPSQGISDYKLELLWGEDAKAPSKEAIKTKTLRLRNIEVRQLIEPCDQLECYRRFSLVGELFNEGDLPLNEITLGVGILLQDQPADSIPEHEIEVSMNNLSLFPRSSRLFQIVIDRLISEREISEFKPALRVLSFE